MSALRQLFRRTLAAGLPRSRFLVRGPAASAAVAVTFDDGPHPEITPRLLDLLARLQLHATFFVIGREAERHPGLVRRMVHEGHAVGHHSWTHTEPSQTSAAALLGEVHRCAALLQSLGVAATDRFRPPKGQLTTLKLARLLAAGQRVVLWSSDPRDYAMIGAAPLVEWARHAPLAGGDVVLMHDVRPFCLDALPLLAARVSEGGLHAVSLDSWLPA